MRLIDGDAVLEKVRRMYPGVNTGTGEFSKEKLWAFRIYMQAIREAPTVHTKKEEYNNAITEKLREIKEQLAECKEYEEAYQLGYKAAATVYNREPDTWEVVEEDAEWFEGHKGTVIQCRKCKFIHTIPHEAKMYDFCPKCGRRKVQEGTI